MTTTPTGFVVDDLGSTNGTYVNGVKISNAVPITRTDTVTLGRLLPMPWPDDVDAAVAPPMTVKEKGHFNPFAVDGTPPSGMPIPAGAKVITIGRSDESDIVLDYPIISAQHARIVVAPQQTWIEDLGSTNGTAIGSPDKKIQRAKLSPSDAVFFGSLRITAARLLKGKLTLGEQPCAQVNLAQIAIVFGRVTQCDQILDDPLISRRHARLTRSEGRVTIEDLGTSNGTYVNGRRITTITTLRPGDIVAMGRFTFKLTAEGNLERRDYRGNVTIEARVLTIDVRDRRLLENVSLTVYPSEFVALMGPSGAGKTTLMNALNGYTHPSRGHVRFNGQNLYERYEQFQGSMGYVPQDDIMHGDLTVGQALYYTAKLRLPRDSTDAEIARRVQAVVQQLGLGGTENVLIGSPQRKGISGGQRKRVNLAMELLTDPSVLFLDEPTSGLSSEDALTVMKLLRRLADDGKTILLTIHQPSLEAYRLLDNLILVSKDAGSKDPGRLAYYGPAYPQAIEFFNPQAQSDCEGLSPDDVLRGLAKDKTDTWVQRFAGSSIKKQFIDDRAGKQPSAMQVKAASRTRRDWGIAQWQTLVRRALAVKVKDVANTAILMAQAPIIALLIALVFGRQASTEMTTENWPSVASAVSTTIFLLALSSLWFGCSNSAREIVGEWAIYRRERMVNLKIPSYVASKFTVLGGLCFIQCAVLLGIVYFGAGLEAPWWPMFGILLLTSLVGLAIGLTVSALARTSEVAIALLPLILLPMVILAGVLQPLHKMNRSVELLAQVMPTRWSFESLLLLEAKERPRWTPPQLPVPPAAATAQAPKQPTPPTPQDVAETFFPQESNRVGVRTGVICLAGMLLLLGQAILTILRARDIH